MAQQGSCATAIFSSLASLLLCRVVKALLKLTFIYFDGFAGGHLDSLKEKRQGRLSSESREVKFMHKSVFGFIQKAGSSGLGDRRSPSAGW